MAVSLPDGRPLSNKHYCSLRKQWFRYTHWPNLGVVDMINDSSHSTHQQNTCHFNMAVSCRQASSLVNMVKYLVDIIIPCQQLQLSCWHDTHLVNMTVPCRQDGVPCRQGTRVCVHDHLMSTRRCMSTWPSLSTRRYVWTWPLFLLTGTRACQHVHIMLTCQFALLTGPFFCIQAYVRVNTASSC